MAPYQYPVSYGSQVRLRCKPIAKSLHIDEITTQSTIAHNDNNCHLERSERSQTHPNLPLEREGTICHPELADCELRAELDGEMAKPLQTSNVDPLNASNQAVSASLNDTVFSRFTSHFSRKRVAFTLAEVLITLGIIGVVAAMTLPSVIQNYQKKVIIERLKKTYSTLSQAVQMSVKDNDDIETWDFSLSTQEFMEKYVIPYVKDVARENPSYDLVRSSKNFALADGTTIEAWSWVNPEVKPFVELKVDINGKNKPNLVGRDIFFFHIFSQKSDRYNGGEGDVAQNIPSAGLYPDGYGYDRNRLMTNTYRGCNNRIATKDENDALGIGGSHRGAFCTALIMIDGWNISNDYKW